MKHYKKLAAGVLGIELFFIMAANVFYYMAAVTREPRIERAQEKTDTIYKIIYTQTDYGTWIFMDIVLGIMFLLSVFFVCYVGEKESDGGTGKRKPFYANQGREKQVLRQVPLGNGYAAGYVREQQEERTGAAKREKDPGFIADA